MEFVSRTFCAQEAAQAGVLRVFRLTDAKGLSLDMQVLGTVVLQPMTTHSQVYSYNPLGDENSDLSERMELYHPAVTAVPFRRELIPYYNSRHREWVERCVREPTWVVKVRIPVSRTQSVPVHLETALVIFKRQLIYFEDVHTLSILSR